MLCNALDIYFYIYHYKKLPFLIFIFNYFKCLGNKFVIVLIVFGTVAFSVFHYSTVLVCVCVRACMGANKTEQPPRLS